MSFLGLPLEVRFMIYAYLRPVFQYLNIRVLLPENRATQLSSPSILLTCKSLHNEVLTCWDIAWPPPVEIKLAEIYTGLHYPPYRPFEGPTWQPEKDFRKIGRAVTSRITQVRLVGHSRIAGTQDTNKPWLQDEFVSVQIGYGVKYLARYFTGLKFVEIYAMNWQAHLWRPALTRLLCRLDSIVIVSFLEEEFRRTEPDLMQAHRELEERLADFLERKSAKRLSDARSWVNAVLARIDKETREDRGGRKTSSL